MEVKDETACYPVRMPKPLYEKLKSIAVDERRPVSQIILFSLERTAEEAEAKQNTA